ncbi:hypothetical protein GCM10010531_14190 [Blastococcus jejuensis]|uniref:Uncharacterized protein n=1 Tax=Blastococcus jejuensis TaxID=351224 RepID=A0ABP6NZY6_9ACTN
MSQRQWGDWGRKVKMKHQFMLFMLGCMLVATFALLWGSDEGGARGTTAIFMGALAYLLLAFIGWQFYHYRNK